MAFPFEIHKPEANVNTQLMKDFTGERKSFLQVGDQKWLLPSRYEQEAEGYYNLPLRKDDLWIVTYPRSGTTWTQELLWLINNDFDYKAASDELLGNRFPFLEFSILLDKDMKEKVLAMNPNNSFVMNYMNEWDEPGYEPVSHMGSPRHIKSHLPLSLLPPSLLDTCKVVYVARNPKDVAVSYYHHNRLLNVQGYQGDFPTYWDYFEKNLLLWSPYWDHLIEAWNQRHHPNMLFLFYEELKKDIKGIIHKVSDFLGKSITDLQVEKLAEHLHIDNFRHNLTVNPGTAIIQGLFRPGEQSFIRKGNVGGNNIYFPPELNTRAEKWIEENLKNTDLRFPF